MKKNLVFCAFLGCLLVTQTLHAQETVAALQHNGSASMYYGHNAFIEAYNASIEGDTIILSAGAFNAPTSLEKRLTVYGSGHYPDSTGLTRTVVMNAFTINAGADSLYIEGLFINNDINFQGDADINYVKIIRCRCESINFNTSGDHAKGYCSVEECVVGGAINFALNGEHLLIRHCLIDSHIRDINSNATIDGNVFLHETNNNLMNIHLSTIQNNIFLNTELSVMGWDGEMTYNAYYNNIFVVGADQIGWGTGAYGANNYFGVAQSDIFVSQSGVCFDYNQNYHLKNPETYLGTDGTQVGLYGGPVPFKEYGMPSTPQITRKSVASQTDNSGNLNVNFTIKAQNR
jgi:hypothetical protein